MKVKIPTIQFTAVLLFLINVIAAHAQSEDLVVIDQDYPNKIGIISSVPVSIKVIELDGQSNIWDRILSEITENKALKSIHLFAETSVDEIRLTGRSIQRDTRLMDNHLEGYSRASFVTNEIDLLVYSCSLAGNDAGISLLENVAVQTRLNVASCKSCENTDGSEFIFDFSTTGEVVTNDLFK